MGTFQGLQGGLGSTLGSYMTNPFGNPFFGTQQQMGTRAAQNLGGMQMSNIARNIVGSGMGGGNMSPAALEMMQNQGRANTGLQSQLGFLNPVQNALGMQQFAMGQANQYRPLQTGGTTTQSTSGLGTWLPQVAGMALGAATGGLGGGLGSLFGGPTSGTFAGNQGMINAAGGMSGIGNYMNAPNQGFIGGMEPGNQLAGMGLTPPPSGGGGSWFNASSGGGGGNAWYPGQPQA